MSEDRAARRNRGGTAAAGDGVVGIPDALLQELIQAFTYIADPSGAGDVTTVKLTEDRLDRLVRSLGS